MSRIKYISMLIFLFLPAFSQLMPTHKNVRADTARLFNELYQIRMEKKDIVDSMEALTNRIDSMEAPGVKMYIWPVDVYRLDGIRERWNFIYKINDKDTVFQRVQKTYSKWW